MTTLTLERVARPALTSRYRVLAGAVLIQLILGTVYGYSIFWGPIQTEMNLEPTLSNYAFAICILSFALTMVIAGRIQDITGPRFPAVVGAVLMGGGFVLASLMKTPVVLYLSHAALMGAVAIVLLLLYHALTARLHADDAPLVKYVPLGIVTAVTVAGVVLGNQYVGRLGEQDQLFMLWGTVGLLAGAGIGFAYVCPIAALVKWFPRHKGLVSGIAVAGFGFGAYIFSHKQLPFSAENYIKNHGITNLFMIHGIISLIAIALGAMLLRNPPTTGAAAAQTLTSDSRWQDTLKRPAFYVLWLMFFSGAMAGLMVIGILKGFAGSQLIDAAGGESMISADLIAQLKAKGVAAVGWLAIFNAVGRIAWGTVSDKIGRTAAFAAMFTFQAVMMFILMGMNSELSLAVAASLIGFNFGGNFALFPSATADLFGSRNVGANYGWVFTSYGIAGVAGIMVGNASVEQTGSYAVAFTIAAALCLLSAALAIGLHINRKRHA